MRWPQSGYVATDAIDEADLVLLNTCHIREKAAEKVYSELGRIRQLKAARERAGREMMIGVAGCVAQAEGAGDPAALAGRRPGDRPAILSPAARRGAPARGGEKIVETDYAIEDKFEHLPALDRAAVQQPRRHRLPHHPGRLRQVLHLLRGALYARLGSVAAGRADRRRGRAAGRRRRARGHAARPERQRLAWRRARTASEWGLGRLLFRLAEIPGLARLRYTTSHPRDMDDALIAAHRDLPALMPYLHLPVQSGSDRILKAMNRRHTVADYLGLIERIRAARPDIAMSGDFIVGFPGETEADFEATLELVRTRPLRAGLLVQIFARGPARPAPTWTTRSPEADKDERLQRLQALLAEQQREFAVSLVGRERRSADREAGPRARPAGWPLALAAAGYS